MTDPIRVFLVDDQQLVRSGFSLVLSTEPGIEVVGQAPDARTALAGLRDAPADVVLMDIQMPGMSGIEATRIVAEEGLGRVIILTTFDRHDYLFGALQAGASGFLLKTASAEDLVAAIEAVAGGHALLSPEMTLPLIQRLLRSGADAPAAGSGAGASAAGPGRSAAGAGRSTADPGAGWDAAPGRGAGGDPGNEPGHAGAPGEPGRAPARELSAEDDAALAALSEREREVLALIARGRSNQEIAAELFLGQATVKTHVSHIFAKTASRDRVQAVLFAHRVGLVDLP
ncbi:response regulator transcription factor [Rothia sp. AR01]|uniref:Response regulator transcription factor n=1 Tax=Rothia santali TaxID=2949643 RepID=A0A9X2KJB0_9MICC|nr:response regulator transcription factor [Rothia santali]MCP3427028.1 response regulator transcription factor [Rothia santali]